MLVMNFKWNEEDSTKIHLMLKISADTHEKNER